MAKDPESGADEEERPSRPLDEEDWTAVRDSWVGTPAPGTAAPPRVTEKVRGLAAPLDAAAFLVLARNRAAAGDAWGALLAGQAVLERDPAQIEAFGMVDRCRRELEALYQARLASLGRVPRVAARGPAAAGLLDPLAGLVLAQVNGEQTLDQIAGSGIVARLDALRVLSELWLRGVIAL